MVYGKITLKLKFRTYQRVKQNFRTRIDDIEKSWIRAITKNDQAKVKALLEERVDLLDYRDYILGVRFYFESFHFFLKTWT